MGFCVASTRNGGSSTCVVPSIDTWRSCIASSSAACVFGGARLISSARRRFEKTGPGRNSNSSPRWFQIDEPVTSVGRRSGVNWTREKRSPVTVANDLAVSVFARPGTSSSRTWPSARRPARTSSSRSRLPTTARSTSSSTAAAWRESSASCIRGAPARPRRARSSRAGGRAPCGRRAPHARDGSSSHSSVPTHRLRPLGGPVEIDAAATSRPDATVADRRSEAVVHVERRAARKGDLSLDALEGRGPRPRAPARREGGVER